MDKPTFLLVGGFLGAGKTTALVRLAERLRAEGKRVGLITNDQAEHLVDTGALRARGYSVEEVAGACFCCKFDELGECAERLRGVAPNVLVGEPVGSCTDLAATVVRPLRQRCGELYSVGPYSVLVDPGRARAILVEGGDGGFSRKVAYIYRKQIEEADVICLNKVDSISGTERDLLLATLRREFPGAPAIAISAASGEGFDRWVSLLRDRSIAAGSRAVEVDYDVYAEGEAELGWLNATYRIEASAAPGACPFDPNDLALEIVRAIAAALAARGAEAAHVKALLDSDSGVAVAHATGGGAAPAHSRRAHGPASAGTLTLNARVHVDPNILRDLADAAVRSACAGRGAAARAVDSHHFRPGRPVPTHRIASAGG